MRASLQLPLQRAHCITEGRRADMTTGNSMHHISARLHKAIGVLNIHWVTVRNVYMHSWVVCLRLEGNLVAFMKSNYSESINTEQTSEAGADAVSPSCEWRDDVWPSCDGVGDTLATANITQHHCLKYVLL